MIDREDFMNYKSHHIVAFTTIIITTTQVVPRVFGLRPQTNNLIPNTKTYTLVDSKACIYFTTNANGQYFWYDASCTSETYRIICQIDDQG